MALVPYSFGSIASFVLISLFINAIVTFLPTSATSGLTEEFYKQDDETSLPTRIDQLKEPRLMDLLQLRQTVSNLLGDSGLPAKGTSPRETSGKESSSPRKRVFCNNFTGCGGRFRGRRRQQIQNAVGKRIALKRPFCNSMGCYNGGKRFLYPSFPLVPTRSGVSHVKRLFCNGFSGCQNMGKRSRGESMETDEQATSIDALDLDNDLDQPAVNLKRFFNGGFDANMEEMLKNLRRRR